MDLMRPEKEEERRALWCPRLGQQPPLRNPRPAGEEPRAQRIREVGAECRGHGGDPIPARTLREDLSSLFRRDPSPWGSSPPQPTPRPLTAVRH